MTEALSSHAIQLCLHRLDVASKALELQTALRSKQTPLLSLTPFHPSTTEHAEVQAFNLSLTIPQRFLNHEEDLAMWLLEKECLDRHQIAAFLSDHSSATCREVLYRIACKIASIEAGSGFSDGLKFFLPVVGFWERCFEEHPLYSEAALRYVLQTYTLAHLSSSKKPLMGLGQENAQALAEVAVCVVDLLKVLYAVSKPQAQAMSDFFTSLRNALRATTINMSIKSMTDLFISTSGSLIQVIKVSATLPSFLFAAVKMEGFVSLSTSFRQASTLYYTRLCHDGLYFFTEGRTDELVAVIPLVNVHTQRCSADNQDLLEVVEYAGGKVMMVFFAREQCDAADGKRYSAFMPSAVTFHDRVLLEIKPKANHSDREVSIFEDEDLRYVEDWVDVLETCAWDCRAANRTQAPAAPSVTAEAASLL